MDVLASMSSSVLAKARVGNCRARIVPEGFDERLSLTRDIERGRKVTEAWSSVENPSSNGD
jgi:hypothetical protein